MSDDVVIVADGLTRTFPGPPEVIALAPCAFSIQRGEMIAVTGPSGSGKTTLLSLLGLLDAPTGGRYRLDGLDVAELSDNERAAVRSRHLGFVFQAFHLMAYRTAVDNVALGLAYQGDGSRSRRRAAREVLDRVGLGERSEARCAHLSGGEKQRVAIARALVCQPAVLLCDEPTGNLDTANTEAVLGVLEQLNRDGMTVIMVTHDPSIAARAGRNLHIRDGLLSDVTLTPVTHHSVEAT